MLSPRECSGCTGYPIPAQMTSVLPSPVSPYSTAIVTAWCSHSTDHWLLSSLRCVPIQHIRCGLGWRTRTVRSRPLPSASSLPPPHSHALPATLCLFFPQRGANFCLPPGRFLTSNCRHLRMFALSGPRGHSNRCASNSYAHAVNISFATVPS